MIRLSCFKCKWFPFYVLALTVGVVPAMPSSLAEQQFSTEERKVLQEYRLYCKPGQYVEDVQANLDFMQSRHPGSTLLKDSAFLAEVHYLDRGFLWDGHGRKSRRGGYEELFDSIFNGYAPSREALNRSRKYGDKSTAFAGLGVLLTIANFYLGLHALFNKPLPGKQRPVAYRLAQLALPAGWIGSFVYSGVCAGKRDRELDNAFFESNGRAIARRLAEDL
jgi:hypothetical protein